MAVTREERIRARLFPGVETFTRRGFTTLPIILRRAQFLFTPRGWQVYTYVLMRTGKAGVAWLTMTEMAYDLAFSSTAKLRKYVDQLVADGWLTTRRTSTREYFLAPDPYGVLKALDRAHRIPHERREELDELLELLNQDALSMVAPAAPATTASPPPASTVPPFPGIPEPGIPSSEDLDDLLKSAGFTEVKRSRKGRVSPGASLRATLASRSKSRDDADDK
jgi:hypothetical protein